MSVKKYSFEKLNKYDLIKFYTNAKTYDANSNEPCYGQIVDLVRSSQDICVKQISVSKADLNNETLSQSIYVKIYGDKEEIVLIDRRAILQIYKWDTVQKLTPRLSLKLLWKNLIFREVKTSVCSNMLYAEFRYIGKTGFEQTVRFKTLEEAKKSVPTEMHKNIVVHYKDFYGFSVDKTITNNDHYYDKEIFFSKKCYNELDWSSDPTGDFIIDEKGFNTINPAPDSLICGIVEDGEKGLFFRKWFVCSKEFFTLWLMVCDPKNILLTDYVHQRVKSFPNLIQELDTSGYSLDNSFKMTIEEKRAKYHVYNLERAALYFPNRYRQVAEVLFETNYEDRNGNSYCDDIEYNQFQKKLIRNLMWPKKFL